MNWDNPSQISTSRLWPIFWVVNCDQSSLHIGQVRGSQQGCPSDEPPWVRVKTQLNQVVFLRSVPSRAFCFGASLVCSLVPFQECFDVHVTYQTVQCEHNCNGAFFRVKTGPEPCWPTFFQSPNSFTLATLLQWAGHKMICLFFFDYGWQNLLHHEGRAPPDNFTKLAGEGEKGRRGARALFELSRNGWRVNRTNS